MKRKESKTTLLRDALKALEIKRFTLAIHDQSFPSFADEEIGYGSIYSRCAADFFDFVKELGFDTVQLGPQGKTTRFNISPYNSTIFSKNTLFCCPDRILKNLQTVHSTIRRFQIMKWIVKEHGI